MEDDESNLNDCGWKGLTKNELLCPDDDDTLVGDVILQWVCKIDFPLY